jgi:hypothetical protein
LSANLITVATLAGGTRPTGDLRRYRVLYDSG